MGRTVLPMREALDERDLVRRAKEGDLPAFDRLTRAHFPRVYGVLFRLVGNHEDAEDMAQDCFVRAFQSLRFYRGEGAFSSWLVRIALHLARDHQRRKGRSAVTVGLEDLRHEPAGGTRSPAGELSGRELSARLSQSIERLPHNLRSALVLRVLEGLEYDEVAEATGMRPGTVRTQVMKARRMLHRWMDPWLERRPS